MGAVPHRLLRSVAAAAVAVSGGTGAHLFAGGHPHPVGVVGCAVLLTAVAWPLAGRERDWLSLAAGQLFGQQLTHLALELTGSTRHLIPHDLMLYLHVLAALLAGGWLRTGERRAWAAARRLVEACAVPQLTLRFDAPVVVGPAAVYGPVEAGTGRLLRHHVVRRGPPLAT